MKLLFVLLAFLTSISATHLQTPLVLAHRGNPCRFPEETLRGYQSAIEVGVDYLELDVISTRDGVLIAHHDVVLDNSTNVAELSRFNERLSTKKVRDRNLTGFFAVDFDLDEIKTLRTRQAFPFRDQSFNDQFQIPSLTEILQLVKENWKNGTRIGAYIELKEPDFHHKHDIDLAKKLVENLKANEAIHAIESIYIQSFSFKALKRTRRLLNKEDGFLPMTWLIGCSDPLPSDSEIKDFAEFGDCLGLDKKMIVSIDFEAEECGRSSASRCDEVIPSQSCIGRLDKSATDEIQVAPIVQLARLLNLSIHAYTFRNEERFMALDFLADPIAELEFYLNDPINLDGVFIDCPETLLRARRLASCPSKQSLSPQEESTSSNPSRRSSKGLQFAVILLLTLGLLVGLCWLMRLVLQKFFGRSQPSRYVELSTENGNNPSV